MSYALQAFGRGWAPVKTLECCRAICKEKPSCDFKAEYAEGHLDCADPDVVWAEQDDLTSCPVAIPGYDCEFHELVGYLCKERPPPSELELAARDNWPLLAGGALLALAGGYYFYTKGHSR